MEIRKVKHKELNQIVNIHILAFKGFFLTELGERFLKTYYNSIRNSKNGILIGYFEDNELLGFCATTLISKGFNKRIIIDNLFDYIRVSIELLFKNPKAILRLYKNLSKTTTEIEDNGEYAELLSIAISPNHQGKGIGNALILELEKILLEKDIKKLSLTTDFYNNTKTLEFYYTLGYKIMYEFITYPNRKMYRLIKSLQL